MAKRTEVLVSRFYQHVGYVTLVTVILWTAIAVYGALSKQPETSVKAEILEPLTPSIDTKTLEMIMSRREISGVSNEGE